MRLQPMEQPLLLMARESEIFISIVRLVFCIL
nr:MAG TPA: hypothetical protein [Caudoviricetes sp.]